MRCFEDCTIPPGPENDVIVVVILAAWTGSVAFAMKKICIEDCPIGHHAYALDCLFRSVPDGFHVGVLLDSDYVATGFSCFPHTQAEHGDPLLYIQCPQWHTMYDTMRKNAVQGFVRKCDDDQDADYI
jgi:hypothetical protein